ncbi:MAG: ABC transporter substrate-binding protein [Candidatus Polarisedimenticolaceae bacterium]|nr:ABC transporter substrate-binding protein [Candidatus Polarisedimenticolaceae bacterium]
MKITPLLTLLLFLLVGCSDTPWNNPYSEHDEGQTIFYSSFSERPKHLDPARSYSSPEYTFIGQIYEPPLQYHFLKRPYELTPLAASGMPTLRYLDQQGEPLSMSASDAEIAFSEYLITIQPNMRYQPHPALARGKDGRYRYHLLDAAFADEIYSLSDFKHTGSREVTAADFVHQIKRIAYPRLHSPIAGLMKEHIVGLADLSKQLDSAYQAKKKSSGEDHPYLDLRQYEMAGLQVVDDHRFTIRINGKSPQFIYWLAMPFFAPMPWEAELFYAQPGFAKRNLSLDWYPIGSGPFMLSVNNPNLRMEMVRNPNFHGESYPAEGMPGDAEKGLLDDAGRALPFIDRAIYSLEKESIPYWNKFLQGYYDNSGVSSDSFDQAVQFDTGGDAELTDEMQQRGIRLSTAVQTSIWFLGFNMRDQMVGGESERARLLRQAISIAVDFEEYVSIFNNGRGVVAQGPIPPGIFGYQSGLKGINPAVYRIENGIAKRRSIDEAKALLEQAGYINGIDPETGKTVLLYYDVAASGPDGKARLNWMRKQFDKLGVQLVIRATDFNRFQEKMIKGTAQVFMAGWNADYPDPENFLFLLHGPQGRVERGGMNAVNYANPEYDKLFEQMKNMHNGPERMAIIDQMVKILRHDAPWSWGFNPKGFSLHHAWYKNATPNLMANNTLKYKRIDSLLREQRRQDWNPPIIWPVWLLLIVLIAAIMPAIYMFRQRERRAAS